MNRRLILIISIVIIILIGILIYFGLIRKPTTPGGYTATGSFLPIGNSTNKNQNSPAGPTLIGITGSTTPNGTPILPRLRHLTLVPTAGDTIIARLNNVIVDRVKTAEKDYYVRYMDRATGHIFEVKTDVVLPQEISNTTIPKIYEATFLPGGNSLIARYLTSNSSDEVITNFITLKSQSATTTASSTSATSTTATASSSPTVAAEAAAAKAVLKQSVSQYLDQDINEIALSPSGRELLTSFYTDSGGIIRAMDTTTGKTRTITALPLREWLLSMPTESKAVLTTKPSGTVNGYSYILDLASGSMQKITGGIAGLTILPNRDLSTYLGAGTPSGITLFLYLAKTDEQKILSLKTLPEKCIWSNTESDIAYCAVPTTIPNALYPDDWYKGRVTFTDDLWQINTTTGETKVISTLSKESGQAIDAINFVLSDDDTYLTFINKKDLTLWGLNLSIQAPKTASSTQTLPLL